MEEKTEKCLDEQRVLIGEREELIGIIEKGNNELKQLEAESVEFFKLYPNFDDNKSLVLLITNYHLFIVGGKIII